MTVSSPGTASLVDTRWVGVGHATQAVERMVDQALADALAGRPPCLVIAFCSADLALESVCRELRAAVDPDVPVVGCTTAGEIGPHEARDNSLVVVALGGSDFAVAVEVARELGDDLRGAGSRLAGAVARLEDRPYRALMLLTDGLAGDQQEIVRGAYSAVGAQVPLVGGCAGDGLRMQRTHVFFNGEVLTDAAVAVAIGSTEPIGIGVRHGWCKIGEPMLVTDSAAGEVLTLDDEPALDVYLDRLGAPNEARTDSAAFTRFALTHPLGLNRRSGEEVRFIAGADFERRSLRCIAEVPQGGLAWIMEGDKDSVLAATDAACADALRPLGDHQPLGLVAFDCIARRDILGDDGIGQEVRRIAVSGQQAAMGGFYTYGEIARSQGTGGFHNQTLVVLAFG